MVVGGGDICDTQGTKVAVGEGDTHDTGGHGHSMGVAPVTDVAVAGGCICDTGGCSCGCV